MKWKSMSMRYWYDVQTDMQDKIIFHKSCELGSDVVGGCSGINTKSAHLRCSNIILFAQKHKCVKQEQHSRAQEAATSRDSLPVEMSTCGAA